MIFSVYYISLMYIFQVVATKNNDRLTLAVAGELEKAFGGWLLPRRESENYFGTQKK